MSSQRPSLAARAAGLDRLLGPSFLLVALLLALGWTLPIITVKRFLILEDPVSILGGLAVLWGEGHAVLALAIGLFSVALPLLKLVLGLWRWYARPGESGLLDRVLARLEGLGRWAMLDVFVVALGVVAIHVSLIGSVVTQPGLYAFLGGVLGSMAVMAWLAAADRRISSSLASARHLG